MGDTPRCLADMVWRRPPKRMIAVDWDAKSTRRSPPNRFDGWGRRVSRLLCRRLVSAPDVRLTLAAKLGIV